MKTLLSSRERKASFDSLKSSGGFIESLSQSQKSTDNGPSELDDGLSVWSMVGSTLAMMEDLGSSCQSGKICCARVIVAYKICQVSAWMLIERVLLEVRLHFVFFKFGVNEHVDFVWFEMRDIQAGQTQIRSDRIFLSVWTFITNTRRCQTCQKECKCKKKRITNFLKC